VTDPVGRQAPSPVGALLTVEGLTADRGGRRILDGVSFSVRPGEILGVIGPNGAGKTTLFECVAGVQPCRQSGSPGPGSQVPGPATAVPSATNAAAPGTRHPAPPNNTSSRQLFYIPDAIRPWPDQSVVWTLELMARMSGTAIPDTLLVELDLERVQRQRVRSLSKGEAKRLNVGLALLASAPLVLLDEPFDGLDVRQARHVMELLRGFVAGGRTLVLSIHQLGDAARICDRVLLLSGGRIVAEGTPAELGDLEELFLARA
jgi:ABC-2 type transport system ATP-binding protein